MYSYMKGTIAEKTEEKCVLEVAGIGYEIYLPTDELESLEIGSFVTIYTYLQHREDMMKLYGFRVKQKLEFFKKLTTVSGVGSKVALGIISNISTEEMCSAIATENIVELKKIPGIGPKMASKIIFELKDKIANEELLQSTQEKRNKKENKNEIEAVTALKVLGYLERDIEPCLKDEDLQDKSIQDIIKLVLRKMKI